MSTEHDHDDYDLHPPEPPEEPSQEPPLTLEEIQTAYDEVAATIWELGPTARIVAVAVPQLIEQLRDAQDRIRPARREFTVTDGDKPAEDAELVTAEQADLILRNNPSKAVWGRDVHPRPWEYISAKPPF
ncbi:hypothetical protein ACFYUV_38015 [Nonomuraea sp. NPDC003560]|uniref:hypothetical protein n=1 Tax=Nonomuraea sp. NPDC003560 TaxID=3364341 RepID=UPI0036C07984